MQAVSRYQAKDGKLFGSKEECRDWEKLIDDCAAAVLPLGPRWSVSGDEGYLQHKPENVLAAKTRLMEIAAPRFRWHNIFSMNPADVHPMSIAGRIINDSDLTPLNYAWGRLCCIDEKSREWDQPFFALNPGKGKNVELEAR